MQSTKSEITFRGMRYPMEVQLKPLHLSLLLNELTFFQTLELHILGRTLIYCDDKPSVIWLCKEHDAYCFSYRRLTEMDVDRYLGKGAT